MKLYSILPITERYIGCIDCIAAIPSSDQLFGIDNTFYLDDLNGGITSIQLTTFSNCCEICSL